MFKKRRKTGLMSLSFLLIVTLCITMTPLTAYGYSYGKSDSNNKNKSTEKYSSQKTGTWNSWSSKKNGDTKDSKKESQKSDQQTKKSNDDSKTTSKDTKKQSSEQSSKDKKDVDKETKQKTTTKDKEKTTKSKETKVVKEQQTKKECTTKKVEKKKVKKTVEKKKVEKKKCKIIITKKDGSKKNKCLKGVKFVLKKNGKKVSGSEKYTNNNGVCSWEVEEGTYEIEELASISGYSKTLYLSNSSGKNVNCKTIKVEKEKTYTFTGKNYPKKGKIKFKKVGYNEKKSGCGITAPVYIPIKGATFVLHDEKGEVVPGSEKTTGEDGYITWSDLPYGKYTIVETAPAPGYDGDLKLYMNGKLVTGYITVGEGCNEYKSLCLTGKNKKLKGEISLAKTDVDGTTPLSGAAFQLYLDGIKIDQEKVVGSNGIATWNNLDMGTYTIEETVAAPGYDKGSFTINGTPVNGYELIIDANNIKDPILLSATNEKYLGSVELLKTGGDGELLAGASFYLEGEGGTILPASTNASGIASWGDLPWGTYKLFEDVATLGYDKESFTINGQPANGYEITIDADSVGPGEVIKLEGVNNRIPGEFELTKVDSVDNTKVLAGAEFSLQYIPEGKTFYEPYTSGDALLVITTDENGNAKLGGLPWGKYKIIEEKAPEGYDKGSLKFIAGSDEFEISAETAQVFVTATNTETEIMGEGVDPVDTGGDVLGETADDPKQEVLGQEAKTADSTNLMMHMIIMMILLALMGAAALRRRVQ